MNKPRTAVAVVFLLFTTAVFSVSALAEDKTSELSFTIRTSVTYSNNGTSIWNFTEEDRAVGLFMNNSWQTVHLVNYSLPLNKTEIDEDGNPIAVLQFPKLRLERGESISFNVSYAAISKPRPPIDLTKQPGTIDQVPANLSEYLSSEGPWLINDTDLKNLANTLTKNETKVLAMVKNFVSWIAEHIKYPYFLKHEVPYYPNETYHEREGDCDDQAILLITLCRISKIPAYLQIGCIYDPDFSANETYWDGHVRNVQDKIGWHGWAMVYVPPWGWLPVDLTYCGIHPTQLVNQPLKAIENAAVTSQNVIQYMNVARTRYIASSLEARDFLQDNGFYVYVRDEMVQNIDQEGDWSLFWVNILRGVLVVAGITSVIVVFVVYSRRRRTLGPPEEQRVQ